jgi:hypothetical protein
LKTTAHVAEPIHSPPAHSPAPSLEPWASPFCCYFTANNGHHTCCNCL